MGKVVLQGDSPFDLGAAQRATVKSVNGGVEISLFFVLPDHGPLEQQIPFRMSPKAARILAERLSAEAVKAELGN
jgi:hypothetical protein